MLFCTFLISILLFFLPGYLGIYYNCSDLFSTVFPHSLVVSYVMPRSLNITASISGFGIDESFSLALAAVDFYKSANLSVALRRSGSNDFPRITRGGKKTYFDQKL